MVINEFFKKILALAIVFSCVLVLTPAVERSSLLGFVFPVFAQSENEEERKALEAELGKYEKQIEEQTAIINKLNKQGKTLKSEIDKLNANIAKLNVQIKAVNLSLKKLDDEIKITQTKIDSTEKNIDFNQKALTEVLRNIYENEGKGIIEIFLANNNLSDFFGNLNNLMEIQDNLKAVLRRIVDLRQDLVDAKETLALERTDAQELKSYQDTQRLSAQKVQSEKGNLLKVTKGKESEYQKLLVEIKKSAAEIRKQIFRLIGGGELSFEKAYELAKSAENATGVRAALILAVLDIESAFGRNVGRCDYQKAMHPTRDIPVFLKIIEDLKQANVPIPEPIKVSCPNPDGVYGGAMGPTQFIPSTWASFAGYQRIGNGWERNPDKDRIKQITGSNPPNPWNNIDAFMATAIYLKDLGAVKGSISSERIAAAKYYAGRRWQIHLWGYGDRVVSKAEKFQDDIDVLSS